MNNNQRGGIHQALEGHYRVSVVDGVTGDVIWQQPSLQKNLILNQGLDAINSHHYVETMTYAVAGTGTRFNYVDPAGSMMTQTGTTATLVPLPVTGLAALTQSFGNYSIAVEVGDIIRYAVGSGGTTDVSVIGVSGTSASVTPSLTINPSQSFTIWKTSQTLLQNEIKRAGQGITNTNYLTGVANCGTTITGTGSVTHYRTYDFVTESISKTYGEIGVSWSSTSNTATIFSRVVLPSTVFVDVGQRLRVFYQLNLSVSPTSSVPRPNVTITNWPVAPSTNTNGSESIQIPIFASINSSDSSNNTGFAVLDPAGISSANIFISNASQSVGPWGTSTDRTGTSPSAVQVAITKNAYTNGTYTCDKVGTFSAASIDISNLRSMGIGVSPFQNSYAAGNTAMIFVFDQPQVKANTQTLTLGWRWTWGRASLS